MAMNIPNLSLIPALVPPPGIIPNFSDPYSLGPFFYVIGGILFAIMLLLVAVRAYMKFYILRKPFWDDCKSLFIINNTIGTLLTSASVTCGISTVSQPLIYSIPSWVACLLIKFWCSSELSSFSLQFVIVSKLH